MEKNLKPVPADKQKSLGKLPEDVRNRMGYAQKGKMMKAKKGKDVKLMENISKESLFGKGRLKTLKKAKDGKMMTFKEFVKQKSGAAVSDKELGNLKTAYMKKLSGAQVSDKEAEKLISMIPGKAKGGEMVKARKGKMMDKKNKNKKPGQIFIELKTPSFLKPKEKAMGGEMKKPMKANLGALALGAVGAKAAKKLMKKKASALSPAMDFLGDTAKKSMGGEAKGYGAARTSGMGLQDENLPAGKSLDYYKDIM